MYCQQAEVMESEAGTVIMPLWHTDHVTAQHITQSRALVSHITSYTRQISQMTFNTTGTTVTVSRPKNSILVVYGSEFGKLTCTPVELNLMFSHLFAL